MDIQISDTKAAITPMKTAVKPGSEIRALTGIRGVAALWVVLIHSFIFIPNLELLTEYPDIHAIKLGYLAVDLFFVLSGFVLAMTQKGTFTQQTLRSLADFISARALRLFPLHWFILAIFFIIIFVTSSYSVGKGPYSYYSLGLTAILIQSLFGYDNTGWNPPAWSISAEIFAYCFFPLIFTASAKFESAKKSIFAFLTLIAILAAILVSMNSLSLDHTMRLGIVRCVFEFSAGVFLWRATALIGRERLPGTALLVAGMAIIALTVAIPGVQLVAPIGFGLVIVACYSYSPLAARLFGNRTVFFLGKISFSIYLVHFLILVTFNYFAIRLALRDQDIALRYAWIALQLPVIIGVSALTWRWVERPGQRLSHRIRRHPARPAASPVELRA